MVIMPFEENHLKALRLQQSQAWLGQTIVESTYGRDLLAGGPCFSAVLDNEVLCCAGLVHIWEGRAQAWSLFSANAGRRFVSIFRAIASFLSIQDVRRIEALVAVDFDQGHRMIEMLDFKREGTLIKYFPHGGDCVMYGRVK
jgi:hypothetical protein